MEILVFRHNGDILLMLNKEHLDTKAHSKQIGYLLQTKLEEEYKRDWQSVGYDEGGTLHYSDFSYMWKGETGEITIIPETYTVQDVMRPEFFNHLI